MTATTQHEDSGDLEGSPRVVNVSRSVAAPPLHVWEVLVSDEGAQALLGTGARLGGKGEPYRTEEGPSGVLRSFHPLEQLRVSWHAAPDAPATVVELDLRPDGESTVLDLTQEHLPPDTDLGELEVRWTAALDALTTICLR